MGLGAPFQNEIVRIRRYSDSVVVTDITDAGKRGKTCEEMHVMPTFAYDGDRQEWAANMGGAFLDLADRGLKAMKALVKDVLVDYPGEIEIHERKLKAVDVEPYGEVFEFKIRQPNNGYLDVKSSPLSFSVIDHHFMEGPPGKDGFFQDTSYWPRKKRDAAVFYAWMKENHQRARRFMNLDMFRQTWESLGIKYDSH